jgi:elongation factor P--(R)-beta-lysine ligase
MLTKKIGCPLDKNNKRISILHDRAAMLAKARDFFAHRNVIEVDVPCLSLVADIATHIDLITALYNQTETCYLHPSAEYGMKSLLSEGIGDIYQLSHVFRDGEYSHKHNPEFMMVEWYRQNITFIDLIHETLDFISLFLGNLPRTIISYREVFQRYAGFDYLKADTNDLLAYIKAKKIPAPSNIEDEGKDGLLNIILGFDIEPHLGKDELCALAYYPSTQAALAMTIQNDDELVAERFEIYFNGVELCNGYHELTDPVEQRKRINQANQARIELGKKALPIDESFLAALEKGLPDSCGVAVGFDRLMMLRHHTNNLSDVIPFRLKK